MELGVGLSNLVDTRFILYILAADSNGQFQ